MKRVLIAASAAALLITACGGGEESGAGEAAATATAPAATETEATETEATGEATTDGAGEGATDRMAVNDQVRSACEEAVVERLPGAEFPNRAVLRAASTEAGKLYTVAGTAQAGGSEHPFTCDVTATPDNQVTVDATTVDGQ